MAKAVTAKKSKATSKAKPNCAKTVESIEASFAGLKENMEDFNIKGTKAAGKRARGFAQDLKKLCHQLRGEIMATIKAGK